MSYTARARQGRLLADQVRGIPAAVQSWRAIKMAVLYYGASFNTAVRIAIIAHIGTSRTAVAMIIGAQAVRINIRPITEYSAILF